MISIAPARQKDTEAIAQLLAEMDRYYGSTGPSPVNEYAAQVDGLLFSDHPAAFILLAIIESYPVGFAAYSFIWPAVGATQSLYLKDLFVLERYRGQGIGRSLMRELCEVAANTRCSRVEWTADRDNPSARAFYDKLGFKVNAHKLFYRIEGDAVMIQTSP